MDGGSAGHAGAISGRPPGPLSGILPSRHLCIPAHQMAEVPVMQEQFPADRYLRGLPFVLIGSCGQITDMFA